MSLVLFQPPALPQPFPHSTLTTGTRTTDGIAACLAEQFSKANNAPLGAALAVTSMVMVGLIALGFVFLNRRWLRRQA